MARIKYYNPETNKWEYADAQYALPGGGGSGSGEDGFSPIVTVKQTDAGVVITVTDRTGTTSATIPNGKNGDHGKNATINGVSALTIETGSGLSGSQAGDVYTLSLDTHSQAASTITAGTFSGEVVANSSGQTPGTSLLRNSKLVSADTVPTVNGEISWTYK